MSAATLTFEGTAGPEAAPGAAGTLATLSSGVTVDEFRMGLREIELEHDEDVEEESEVKFEGRFRVDVLAGTIDDLDTGSTEQSILALLPFGTFEELELKLRPLPGVDPTQSDPQNALYVAGGYTSGTGEPRTFEIRVLIPFKIEVEGPQAIVLDAQTSDLIVAIHLDVLLSPANLDMLLGIGEITSAVGSDYTVTVDGATSLATLETLDDLVKSALEFGEDRDGDDELEDNEDVDDDSNGL